MTRFPYKLGYDCAGVVAETGSQVSSFKVGDEVYVRLPERSRGSWSEYAKCAESFVAHKPKNLSFGDAASLPLAALTTLQALRKYRGSLAGKTVFVPGGCERNSLVPYYMLMIEISKRYRCICMPTSKKCLPCR
jgi:NADPH:quinone reductase-like Zn-dependent oxidoreductase